MRADVLWLTELSISLAIAAMAQRAYLGLDRRQAVRDAYALAQNLVRCQGKRRQRRQKAVRAAICPAACARFLSSTKDMHARFREVANIPLKTTADAGGPNPAREFSRLSVGLLGPF